MIQKNGSQQLTEQLKSKDIIIIMYYMLGDMLYSSKCSTKQSEKASPQPWKLIWVTSPKTQNHWARKQRWQEPGSAESSMKIAVYPCRIYGIVQYAMNPIEKAQFQSWWESNLFPEGTWALRTRRIGVVPMVEVHKKTFNVENTQMD